MWNMASTAARSSARAASPYTVSVGITTGSPRPSERDASAKACSFGVSLAGDSYAGRMRVSQRGRRLNSFNPAYVAFATPPAKGFPPSVWVAGL